MEIELRARRRESWHIASVDFARVARVANAMAYSQIGRLGSHGATTYRDPDLLHMVEAGIVVSYARPFMATKPGEGGLLAYSQLSRDFVPVEHRDLHDLLMERRKHYIAHTGATDPPLRSVDDQSAGAGWVMVSEPVELTREQLIELVELARMLSSKLSDKLTS